MQAPSLQLGPKPRASPSPSRQGTAESRGRCLPQVGPTLGVISSLRKVFLSESFYHLPRTLQSIPNASSCGSYCRRAHCHHQHISWRPVPADGCSRGKAIDLNILEGSRPLPSARDNRFLHLLRQKKKRVEKPPKPSPIFLLALLLGSAVHLPPESTAHCIPPHTHSHFIAKICFSNTPVNSLCKSPC